MPDVTFRDFAMAAMPNPALAAQHLQTLLGLDAPAAEAATAHFKSKMTDPAFMMKAMSLRTAVTSGSDTDIAALLRDCFGLAATDAPIAALRTRYPAPA